MRWLRTESAGAVAGVRRAGPDLRNPSPQARAGGMEDGKGGEGGSRGSAAKGKGKRGQQRGGGGLGETRRAGDRMGDHMAPLLEGEVGADVHHF